MFLPETVISVWVFSEIEFCILAYLENSQFLTPVPNLGDLLYVSSLGILNCVWAGVGVYVHVCVYRWPSL